MSVTLATAGGVSIATGLAFGVVARAVSRRAVAPENLIARRAHAAWWLALGAYLVLQGALTLVAAADALTLGTYLASRVIAIPLLCAATWGITFYLVHLYTGSARLAVPLGLMYAGVAALFFWATFGGAGQELRVEPWLVGLDDDAPAYRAIYVLVGLPPILASLAFLTLLPRLDTREQRYRVVLLAGSILAYVGSGLAARLAADDAIVFATLVPLGLAAGVASVAAYHPPAFVRRALDLGRR